VKQICIKIIVSYFLLFLFFLELPDTKCVLILNHSIDQFTFYNFLPAFDMNNAYSDDLDEKMRNIRSFEGMYNVYEKSVR